MLNEFYVDLSMEEEVIVLRKWFNEKGMEKNSTSLKKKNTKVVELIFKIE